MKFILLKLKLNTTAPIVTSTKKTRKPNILQGPIKLGLLSKFIEGLEELQKFVVLCLSAAI